MDVFQQFGHFRDLGAAHQYHLIDSWLIKGLTNGTAIFSVPSHDFGDSARFEIRVARVFPFWRVDQKNILTGFQATIFRAWQQLFFSGTRVCSAFQRKKMTRTKMGFQSIHCINHETHIRLAIFIQWSGNT
ncbi:hypothetical protein A11A3_14470 [Alcanivorax hongdengensis A-11-3]|uniref:Uncharacterized protein n=1 Tax=Alcanivorax hongdengensis A-11-3 TaxID=1177179 RepID=L0W8K1_9GAMM|nr:hypothetical protein A11A3_14470 [Alcanivorax hongdengensis A-11-3]